MQLRIALLNTTFSYSNRFLTILSIWSEILHSELKPEYRKERPSDLSVQLGVDYRPISINYSFLIIKNLV